MNLIIIIYHSFEFIMNDNLVYKSVKNKNIQVDFEILFKYFKTLFI